MNLKVAQATYRAPSQLGSHSEILFQTYKQCNKITIRNKGMGSHWRPEETKETGQQNVPHPGCRDGLHGKNRLKLVIHSLSICNLSYVN